MRPLSPHRRARWDFLRSRLSALLANSGRGPGQQFEMSIGCVPFRLQMSDAQLFGAASARYAAFKDAAAQPITIALATVTRPVRRVMNALHISSTAVR